MFGLSLRRKRREAPLALSASDAARACAAQTGLPLALCELLSVALDEDMALARRLRALDRLERGAGAHGGALARLLIPALAASPDLASRVHLALLALAPDLAVGRGEEGRLQASARPLSALPHDGVAGRIEPGLGRVVGLDALASLFGPEEALPAFLARPARSAPAPYRPPTEVLERRRREEEAARERERRRALLHLLELAEDDLDDDPEERLAPGLRHRIARRAAPTLVALDEPTPLLLGQGERQRALGLAQAGEWWSDLRLGDHQGAERWHLRLARDAASARPTVRRAPRLLAPDGVVRLELGEARVEQLIAGRSLVPFVELDGELIVGVTLCWSSQALRAR